MGNSITDTSSPERIAWEGELYRLRELCVGVNEIEMDSPKIRLWTFMLFNDYTRESLPGSGKMVQRLEYWFDLGHCRPKMGDQMVDVIMGITKAPETGVNLLLTDWKTFRQSWLDAHESYCNSNVDDITWYLDAGGRGSN